MNCREFVEDYAPINFSGLSYVDLFFFSALRSNAGLGLLIHEISRSHSMTHHIRYDSSGRVISSSKRPLTDNTQHSQQINIHAPCGIRTHNFSKREATVLRLRQHGYWDRHLI
jgi:hypothetical protein